MIRRGHLRQECWIKTLATLHLLGAVTLIASMTASLIKDEPSFLTFLAIPVAVIMAMMNIFLFSHLRRFQQGARWIALAVNFFVLAVSVFNLSPLGVPVCAVYAVILMSRKSKMIFSTGYQEIIAATPHITEKTSRWLWIPVACVLGFFVEMYFIHLRKSQATDVAGISLVAAMASISLHGEGEAPIGQG